MTNTTTIETNASQPPCPLCDSGNTSPLSGYQNLGEEGWSLHQCHDCGTGFIHPVPTPETLASYYDDDYYGCGTGKFLGPVEVLVRLFRRMRAKSIRKAIPSGRVLDVGCGRGVMLSFLKEWGYEVDGVELDTLAAERAFRNIGKPVYHSLDDLQQHSPILYDVICFWHSLEHMPHPGQILKKAHALLKPGGILVIAAPHMASIQSHMAGPSWLHLDLPRHLAQFDMSRLGEFMEKQAYTILHHSHFSQEYNVIDTLCYCYDILGFDPFYPFHMIRHIRKMGPRTWREAMMAVWGLTIFIPLTVLAFLLSNLFSLVYSGSTTTLYLKKGDGSEGLSGPVGKV